jgi:hypothetical protein
LADQIIKQPNGKYAIWNTVVDEFYHLNMTRDGVIDYFVEANGRLAYNDDPDLKEIEAIERRRIAKLVDAVDNGTITSVRSFWQTWDECIAWLKGDYNKAPGEGKRLANDVLRRIV